MALIGVHGVINSDKDTVATMLQFISRNPQSTLDDYMKEKLIGVHWYNDVDGFAHTKWSMRRFGDKLKSMLCLLLGVSREMLEDREFKEKPLGKDWVVYVVMQHGIYEDREEGIYLTEQEAKTKLFSHMDYIVKREITPRYLMQSLGTEWGRKMIHPDLWCMALMNKYDSIPMHDANHCPGGPEIHKTICFPKWIIPDVRFPNEAQAINDRDGVIINIIRPDTTKTNHSSETSLSEWQFDHTIINDGTLEDLFNKVKSLQLV